MFKWKLTPIIIAVAGLMVVVLGATPLGQATRGLVLPKSSVGPAQLKKGAVSSTKIARGTVSGAKIANDAITSAKVKDGSLLASDFKPGQLAAGPQGPEGGRGPQGQTGNTGPPGPKGDTGDPGHKGPAGDHGSQGIQGVKGAKGDKGNAGPLGLSGYVRVAGPWASIPMGGVAEASATCPPGKKAVGGGFETSPNDDLLVIYDGPVSGTGWTFRGWDLAQITAGGSQLRVWAICGSVS